MNVMFPVNPLHYAMNGLGGKLGYNHFGSLTAKLTIGRICYVSLFYNISCPSHKERTNKTITEDFQSRDL